MLWVACCKNNFTSNNINSLTAYRVRTCLLLFALYLTQSIIFFFFFKFKPFLIIPDIFLDKFKSRDFFFLGGGNQIISGAQFISFLVRSPPLYLFLSIVLKFYHVIFFKVFNNSQLHFNWRSTIYLRFVAMFVL